MTGGRASADTPLHRARRALLAELDNIIAELGKRRRSDAAIHDIRKELKRARAALRLLRDGMGVAQYRRDNALIRDAARPLTPIRDAKVLLQTLTEIGTKRRARGSQSLDPLRKLLENKRRLARRELQSAHLNSAARVLLGIRRRVAALPDSRLGGQPRGLRRAFKKARSAFAAAKLRGTDASFHECRKQTKYFANQLELILPLGPKLFDKSHRYAAQLADCLGDDHDLAILTDQISQHAARAGAAAADPHEPGSRSLLRTLERQRKKLKHRAMRLGRRLYSGKASRYRL